MSRTARPAILTRSQVESGNEHRLGASSLGITLDGCSGHQPFKEPAETLGANRRSGGLGSGGLGSGGLWPKVFTPILFGVFPADVIAGLFA